MELRHLRYFEAVAHERSFTRAAQNLHVAQPALSRQVRALEAELGTPLFERDQRPVKLTEAGRLCLQTASHILASVENMRRAIQQINQRPTQFVVGIVGSIMHGCLPKILRVFREQVPGIELELVDIPTMEQVIALKEGRIDAGLGRVRVDDPEVRRENLIDEPLLAAFPASFNIPEEPGGTRMEALAAHTLIAYPAKPRPSHVDQVLNLFRDNGVIPAKVIEVSDIQAALGLVSAEVGIAIVPSSLKHLHRDDIRYLPLADRHAYSPVFLNQRKTDARPVSDLFRYIARDVFHHERI
jgi:DNA-binding transcriptional LysR family regulator